jgi:hypothetical protein
MPFKSEKQRRWMHVNKPAMAKGWEKKLAYSDRKEKKEKMKKETKVRELIRKMVREIMAEMNMNEGFAGALKEKDRKKFDKGRQKQAEVLGYKLAGTPDVKTEIGDATVQEAKKRDYKAEYKKYGSSKKAKKYRAELNKYNRQKGTYGNGDGLDASHKNGKIVGFEEQSKNRGRAEKSRLKKEEKLSEKFIGTAQKNHFLNLIKLEIDSLKGQIAYSKDALRQKDIEDWEKKEFKAVLKDKIKDLKELIARQKRVSKWKVSEGKLKEKKNKGLWANIHAKRKRGEKPAKKGDKNYPKTLDIEGKLNEAKETIFDVAARVINDKQAYKYKSRRGQVLVDMQSANLLVKVFKKVNTKMKKILSDLGEKNPAQLMNTLWAVVK